MTVTVGWTTGRNCVGPNASGRVNRPQHAYKIMSSVRQDLNMVGSLSQSGHIDMENAARERRDLGDVVTTCTGISAIRKHWLIAEDTMQVTGLTHSTMSTEWDVIAVIIQRTRNQSIISEHRWILRAHCIESLFLELMFSRLICSTKSVSGHFITL